MNEAKVVIEAVVVEVQASAPVPKQPWETPTLEDVSEEVMAQPYIRFT